MLDVRTFRGSLSPQISSGVDPSGLKHKHFTALPSIWKNKSKSWIRQKKKGEFCLQLEIMELDNDLVMTQP